MCSHKFIEQTCSKTSSHTQKMIKNNLIELSYHEDIKIDKDIRFFLRQEMKEMDWVVFHTSHSLSIPLRRPLLPPSPADFLEKRQNLSLCEMRSVITSLMENHLQYRNHQTTNRHTHMDRGRVHTFLIQKLRLSLRCTQTHRCVAKGLPWQLSYIASQSGWVQKSVCVCVRALVCVESVIE